MGKSVSKHNVSHLLRRKHKSSKKENILKINSAKENDQEHKKGKLPFENKHKDQKHSSKRLQEGPTNDKINSAKENDQEHKREKLPFENKHKDQKHSSKRVQEGSTNDEDKRSKDDITKTKNSTVDNLQVGDENLAHKITHDQENINHVCQMDIRQTDPPDCQTPRNVREDDSNNLAPSQEHKLQETKQQRPDEKPEIYNRRDKQESSKQLQSNVERQLTQQKVELQTSQFHDQPQHRVPSKLFLHKENVEDNQSSLHGDANYNISEVKSLQVGDNYYSTSPTEIHIRNYVYSTPAMQNEPQGFQQTNEQPQDQHEKEIEQDVPEDINHDENAMPLHLEMSEKIDSQSNETDDNAFEVGETFAVHAKDSVTIPINKQPVILQEESVVTESLDQQYYTSCPSYSDMLYKKKCSVAKCSQSRQRSKPCQDHPLQRSRSEDSLLNYEFWKPNKTVRKIKQPLKFRSKSALVQQINTPYKKERAAAIPIENIPLRHLKISMQSPRESDLSLDPTRISITDE